MGNIHSILLKILSVAKTPWGWAAAVFTYLSPLQGVFWLIFLIAITDFITGIGASAKKKIPRSSKRLRKSIEKLLCYIGVIYLFFEFEKQIGIEDLICTYKMIAGFIFIVEIVSILENMAVITENQTFIKIIRFIRGKSAQKGDSLISDILDEKHNEYRD